MPTDTPTPATTPAPKCPNCGRTMLPWQLGDSVIQLRCVGCGTTRPLGWTGDAPDAGHGGEPRAEGAMSREEMDELRRLEAAATPAAELSLRGEQWIERRAANGEKYSIAEFEHEADQELYYAARNALPRLLATLDAERAANAKLRERLERLAKEAKAAEKVICRLELFGGVVLKTSYAKPDGEEDRRAAWEEVRQARAAWLAAKKAPATPAPAPLGDDRGEG
jgi:hypothetical protein